MDAEPPADARPDAAIDATPAEANRTQEITPVGGRVEGGGYTMDVQVGHWFEQKPAHAGDTTIEGAAAVK